MKPIDYFSTFEEGKNEFIEASKKNDTLAKLEAIKKMGSSASKILENNYHIKLQTLFDKESKENPIVEARKAFNTWKNLISVNSEYLDLVGKFYQETSTRVLHSIDTLKLVENYKNTSSKNSEKMKELLDEDPFIRNVLKGTEYIVNGVIPYSHVIHMIQELIEDSFFLKDEEITTGLN